MKTSAKLRRIDPRRPSWVAAASGLLVLAALPAFAAPLDKNACAKLAQDMQNMKTLAVDKLMEKGPAWAASHLSPGDLSLIKQYIDIDEQMKFRCSAPGSLVHLKHLEEEDEESQSNPGEAAEPSSKKTQNGDGAENTSPAGKRKALKAPAKRDHIHRAESGAR